MNSHRYCKLTLLIMGVITICSLSCALYLGFVSLGQTSDDLAVQELGLRLEIEPSWPAFNRYVFDKLEKGTPREKILQELDKIGPYVIEPRPSGDCEIVQFRMGIFNLTHYSLILCYEYDGVQSLRSAILDD